jgi:hypothetical protein
MADRRRFPPPWDIEDKNDACFIVRDADGQALAYVYYENEPVRRNRRQSSHGRRGAAHRGEHRQVAGRVYSHTRTRG